MAGEEATTRRLDLQLTSLHQVLAILLNAAFHAMTEHFV